VLAGADAVVWSRGSRVAEHSAFVPHAIRQTHPHLTVTSITPFGLEGPWSDRAATEFTLQAWSGGIIGLGRGAPDRAPVYVGGQVGEWVTGSYAAIGTMASWSRRQQSGAGELVDLSMLEAQILTLTYRSVEFNDALGRPFRSERTVMVPGVSQAKDGVIALGCGTAQQWFDLCAMIGRPEWIDEDRPFSITGEAADAEREIRAWIAEHSVADIRELATAFRIPNAPVANGANITTFEHYQKRGTFEINPGNGHLQPAAPYHFEPPLLRRPVRGPRLGEHTETYRDLPSATPPADDEVAHKPLPLQGVTVLDMTAYWAGPSCTHVLALLGAEVIHVESVSRLDGTRMIAGVPLSEDQWWEKSPIFSGLNTNKKSVTVDFRREEGRDVLHRLIKLSDVLVENYTPRVLENLGLDYAGVRALRPDTIMVRMPGFGLEGPWRDNPAFAYIIEDASGLTWLTGHSNQNPVEPYSIGDSNAGLHALTALLVALEHRRRTGDGVLVEAAMVDAAINVAAEQVIEYSAYGRLLQRDGNRGPVAAPQNLYRTADIDEFGRADCWVAVAVATDGQWEALRDLLGNPQWAVDPELTTADGRRTRHDTIDEHLSAWCEHRSGDDIVALLWDAGVPVAKVVQPHRVADLPQVIARGFYETVEHPVSPPARHATLPFRLSESPDRFHVTHAPLLGEHNHELLIRAGFSAAEISGLESDGIIGHAPAM
jgi:crotonobetainyl-CoA:carnitine CoA-transferase CaiB-like acyl-CoA transferase